MKTTPPRQTAPLTPPSFQDQPPKTIQLGRDVLAEAVREIINPPSGIRVPEWPKFSDVTRGLRSNEFSIFCGSTGSGKTQWMSCLSLSLLRQNIPQFVLSVETGRHDYVKRMLSAFAKRDLNCGVPVGANDVRKVIDESGDLFLRENLFVSIYENRVKIETLVREIEFMVASRGVKLVIMDNLNFFMEVTSSRDTIVEMDRTVHELVLLAKRIPAHLMLIAHPRKTENTRVLSEFDIKGSSTAVQEASNVFLFNRADPELRLPPHFREVTIAKMRRNGRAVGKTILFDCIDGVYYAESSAQLGGKHAAL